MDILQSVHCLETALVTCANVHKRGGCDTYDITAAEAVLMNECSQVQVPPRPPRLPPIAARSVPSYNPRLAQSGPGDYSI